MSFHYERCYESHGAGLRVAAECARSMAPSGVYETLLFTPDGRPHFSDLHLLRMGIGLLRLGCPRSCLVDLERMWNRAMDEVTVAGGALAGTRRMRVFASCSAAGSQLALTVFTANETGYAEASPETAASGITIAMLPIRRSPGKLARVKSSDLTLSTWARGFAEARGASEAIWATLDGMLLEGVFSNLFIVKQGTLLTAPSAGILPGITRGVILVLAEQAGLPIVEARPTMAELYAADEVFMTSSAAGVLPVTAIADGSGAVRIGSEGPGPLTLGLQRLYEEHLDDKHQ